MNAESNMVIFDFIAALILPWTLNYCDSYFERFYRSYDHKSCLEFNSIQESRKGCSIKLTHVCLKLIILISLCIPENFEKLSEHNTKSIRVDSFQKRNPE